MTLDILATTTDDARAYAARLERDYRIASTAAIQRIGRRVIVTTAHTETLRLVFAAQDATH